jgi:N-methylhydantoinase A
VKRLAGVDVGGTFTDFALWDTATDTVVVHKVPTTPDDPTRAIVEGLAHLGAAGDSGDGAVVHGTTLITNALIERRGALTGLVTTEGYRDVLEIGSELRYDTFDLFLERPVPLVARAFRRTVPERMGADGTSVVPLDEEAVRAAGRALTGAGVQAVAVALFNAYRNPTHEHRAAEILRAEFPSLAVCAACDIAPEIREYERISTAAANAYVQPMAARYLDRLANALAGTDTSATRRQVLFVMLSDGGITTARDAAERPIGIVESGPAAGAMIGAHTAGEGGWARAITFDMGGTTAKISLIHSGVPERRYEMEVARVHRFKKGSGLPIRVPVVQLIEIGAGGGSIASLDTLGLLKVGPRSAGAAPGPACYGLGGEEATVTDADLHLGYIDADAFLGGRMALDLAKGNQALARLGRALGLGLTATAAGIHDVVNNNMATAARIHIAEHGHDPRAYRLIAFGGAGPVHAYGLARLLHVSEIVYPRAAGVASAAGMLIAPRSVEYTRSLVNRVDALDWSAVRALVTELEHRARSLLHEAGVEDGEVAMTLAVDMRYAGQGYEVTVAVARAIVERADVPALVEAFEVEYRRRFDRTVTGAPIETISWRVRAQAPPVVRRLRYVDPPPARPAGRPRRRPVYFQERRDFVETLVYRRADLRLGETIVGPAVIEEAESTIVCGPSGRLRLDDAGHVVVTIDHREG